MKPAIDVVTGCAHIKDLVTYKHLAPYKHFRVCSVCDAEMPEEIEEEQINYCWWCGFMFDHTDDDPDSTKE